MSELLDQNDSVHPIRVDLDYWTNLKETCERNRVSVRGECERSEGDNESDVKMEFIREQLGKNCGKVLITE